MNNIQLNVSQQRKLNEETVFHAVEKVEAKATKGKEGINMLLVKLEHNVCSHVSRIKSEYKSETEVIDLGLGVTTESYLVDKLIDRYSGVTDREEAVDELWEIRTAIRENRTPDVDTIWFGDDYLEVTVINEQTIIELIAHQHTDRMDNVRSKIKIGDLVVDELMAKDRDHAKAKYLELYEECTEEELEELLSRSLDLIEVEDGYWIAVENIY